MLLLLLVGDPNRENSQFTDNNKKAILDRWSQAVVDSFNNTRTNKINEIDQTLSFSFVFRRSFFLVFGRRSIRVFRLLYTSSTTLPTTLKL
jgi:uncharacterized protein with WD repeat